MSIQGNISSLMGSVSSLIAMKKIADGRKVQPELSHQEQVEKAAEAKIQKQQFDKEVDDLVLQRQKADEMLQVQQDSKRETRQRTSGHEMSKKMNMWLGVEEDGTE